MNYRKVLILLAALFLTNTYADSKKSKQLVDEGWQQLSQNNLDLFEQKLKQAIEEDENNTRAYIGLSYLYQMQYKNKEAWQQFKNILETEKNYFPYIHSAIFTPKWLLSIDDQNSGILDILKNLTGNKNTDGMLRAVANEQLGRYYSEHNDLSTAIKYYNDMGTIDEWTLIGPFENISASGFDNVFPPELEYDPDKEYEGKSGIPVKWFEVNKIRWDRWVDFRLYFARTEAVFYGNTFIYSPKKQNAQIRVGTSGSLKMFLNDQQTIEYFDENNNDLDTYIAEIQLQEGWNRLLIKCGYSEITQCNFLVRITDTNGDPLSGIKVSKENKSYPKKKKATVKLIPNIAETFFQQKIKSNPDHPENYLLLADCYLKNDKAIEAELVLREAIKRSPNNVLLLNHMIEAYARGEKYDEQSTTMEKIHTLNENIPSVLEDKFIQYLRNQNIEKAEEILIKLEKLVPESERIYIYKIRLYSAKNIPEKIYETSSLGYQKFPDNWELALTEARLSALKTRTYDEAIKIIESYLDKHTRPEIFLALAEIYLTASNFDKWESTYKKLIEFNPASTGFYYNMAESYAASQKYSEAEKYIKEAIAICPNSEAYWAKLGEIKRATDEIDDAKQAYRTALQLYPAYYDARDKLRELEGKKSIFENFESMDTDMLIKNAANAEGYPESGALILLTDVQRVVYEKGASESTHEKLIKVFNDQGIDDFKEYYLAHNPYTEELIIEKAVVVKEDGSEIEADKNRNHIVFKSLEENDVIHVKWKIRNYYSGNLSNHFWDEFNFNSFYPIQNIRYSILVPENFEFNYKAQNMPADPLSKEETDDGILYVWKLTDVPSVEQEYRMPVLDDVGKMLYISSIKNWEYIVDWYTDLAKTKTRSSFEIKEQVEKLFQNKQNVSELEKITIIHNFITENIRYSSVSFRQSGLIPQKSRDVLVNKIGDCKDVATLCIAMLNEAGIKANYLLVNSKDNGLNKNVLPSILFNHAIVEVERKESSPLYLDLTAQNYPVGSVPGGDMDAFVLKIKPGTKQPFYLSADNFDKRKRERKSFITINTDNSIFAKKSALRTGAQSAYTRSTYRFKGEKERNKILTESLGKDYPNVKVTKFEIENIDSIMKSISYYYEFIVPDFASDVGGFKIIKFPWADGLETTKALSYETREYTFNYWPSADTLIEVMDISLPSDYKPMELEENSSYSCPVAEYNLSCSFKNGAIKAKRTFINKMSTVTPQQYIEFKQFYNNVVNADARQILLKK